MVCGAIMGRRKECLSQMASWLLLLAATIYIAPAAWSRELPVIVIFGDSNSDIGGFSAGLGYIFPLPEGRIFFNRSTGRLCDGRLILDFLCESLNSSYLCPWSLDSDFTNGASFVAAGSATQPRNQPFSLLI